MAAEGKSYLVCLYPLVLCSLRLSLRISEASLMLTRLRTIVPSLRARIAQSHADQSSFVGCGSAIPEVSRRAIALAGCAVGVVFQRVAGSYSLTLWAICFAVRANCPVTDNCLLPDDAVHAVAPFVFRSARKGRRQCVTWNRWQVHGR